MSSKNFEVYIKSLKINSIPYHDSEDKVVVCFTIYHPSLDNSDTSEITKSFSSKDISADGAIEKNYGDTPFNSVKNFNNSFLFKLKLEGNSCLSIKVVNTNNITKLQEKINSVLKDILTTVIGVGIKSISNSYVSGTVGCIGDALTDAFFDDDDSNDNENSIGIGESSCLIIPSEISPSLTMNLNVNKDKKTTVYQNPGLKNPKEVTIIAKGGNGTMELLFKEII